MGTYTEVRINIKLKEDTPPQVLEMLRLMVEGDWKDILAYRNIMREHSSQPQIFTHAYWDTDHWYCFFDDFTKEEDCFKRWNKETRELDVWSSLKAYDRIIDKFVDWVKPYLDESYDNYVQRRPESWYNYGDDGETLPNQGWTAVLGELHVTEE